MKKIGYLISVAVVVLLALASYSTSETVTPYNENRYTTTIFGGANNLTEFSTISGQGSAVDLGAPVCNHTVILYNSGTWLTTSVAPGLQIVFQGSNDNTNYVPINTHWWTASGTAEAYAISSAGCFRYVKIGWTSSAGAWAWTTPSTGKVNALVTSTTN